MCHASRPLSLLSEMDPDQVDLWPELRSSLWCSSQQHHLSCHDDSAAQTAAAKGVWSRLMYKEMWGDASVQGDLIYKHLLSCRAVSSWIILILSDMSALKLFNLIPALISPPCMLRRTFFFSPERISKEVLAISLINIQ